MKLFDLFKPVFLAFLFISVNAFSQTSFTGRVTGGNSEALPGVTITEKGTSNATVSKEDGSFSIRLTTSKPLLVLSNVGFTQKEVAVGSENNLTITLDAESRQLNDVVVVGYGTQRKKDLTGAIASVGAKDLEKIPASGVDKALQGQVAGLQISTTSGAPGGNTTILVRGISSITGGIEPLFVVDGYPVSSVGYSNPLSTINPNDIESIDVLKDASATAIYGSRGSNGVIIITTKRGKSGKPRIEFDSYVGFQEVAHRVKLMDAQQFASFVIDGRNAGYLDNTPTGNINDNNNVRPGASWTCRPVT